MNRRHKAFDLFIMPENVSQVFYVPYPSTQGEKQRWCVAIKTKPQGRIQATDVKKRFLTKWMKCLGVNEVIKVEPIEALSDDWFPDEEVELVLNLDEHSDKENENEDSWEVIDDEEKLGSEDED